MIHEDSKFRHSEKYWGELNSFAFRQVQVQVQFQQKLATPETSYIRTLLYRLADLGTWNAMLNRERLRSKLIINSAHLEV